MKIYIVAVGSNAKAMAPKTSYGERLEKALKEVVEARSEELKNEFKSVLGSGFELNCRRYF